MAVLLVFVDNRDRGYVGLIEYLPVVFERLAVKGSAIGQAVGCKRINHLLRPFRILENRRDCLSIFENLPKNAIISFSSLNLVMSGILPPKSEEPLEIVLCASLLPKI
jgi:hypothetical protein